MYCKCIPIKTQKHNMQQHPISPRAERRTNAVAVEGLPGRTDCGACGARSEPGDA